MKDLLEKCCGLDVHKDIIVACILSGPIGRTTVSEIREFSTLAFREAAEYSNIGINKIDAMLKQPGCPFVIYIGTKNWLSGRSLKNT